ncbi:natural cytotoxicity triggering receptor 3 [Leptodactylus fuscus]
MSLELRTRPLDPTSGVLFQEIQVFQVPEIHATPGSDVTLPCAYNVSGVENTTIGSYRWYRHLVKIGPEVSDSNKDFTGRISRTDTDHFIKNRSAPITIQNVEVTDTGTYYCTVSITDGREISGSGAGTFLNVTGVLLQEIQVFQVPEIHAIPGSDVTLPCTYNVSGVENTTIGSYKWYRHLVKIRPEMSYSNTDFTGWISRADTDQFIKTRSAPITIHNVDLTDTGTYYCEVNLRYGGEISGHGAGTFLNVTGHLLYRGDHHKDFTARPRHMMIRQVLGLIILGALGGVLLQEIQVFQVPEIHATPGSDVTLPCTYNVSGDVDATIGSYRWYRHLVKIGPELSDSNKDFTGRISRPDTDQFLKTRSAPITIHNVDLTDTGTYYCEVSITDGREISGNGAGTFLNVRDIGMDNVDSWKTVQDKREDNH